MKAIVAAPIVVRMRATRFDLPVNRISETTNSIPEESPTEKNSNGIPKSAPFLKEGKRLEEMLAGTIFEGSKIFVGPTCKP